MPFPHNKVTDVAKLGQEMQAIQKSLAYVDLFEDFKGLGLELDKEKDFLPLNEVSKKLAE